MFIRKTLKKNLKTGKKYFSYQLVESVRTERGPRQRILMTVGHEVELTVEERKLLANRIEELITGTHNFVSYPEQVEQLAHSLAAKLVRGMAKGVTPQEAVATESHYENVDLNSLAHENLRSVGLEYISLETIRRLRLDTKLQKLGLTDRQINACLGVIIARLVQPSSERAAHAWL